MKIASNNRVPFAYGPLVKRRVSRETQEIEQGLRNIKIFTVAVLYQ
jgi:hypothetical protein